MEETRRMEAAKDGYVCINCYQPSSSLFLKYSDNGIRLTPCSNCGKAVDAYIEYDTVLVIIDLMLQYIEAYRHFLMNTSNRESLLPSIEMVIHVCSRKPCTAKLPCHVEKILLVHWYIAVRSHKWIRQRVISGNENAYDLEWKFYECLLQSLVEITTFMIVLVFFRCILLQQFLLTKCCKCFALDRTEMYLLFYQSYGIYICYGRIECLPNCSSLYLMYKHNENADADVVWMWLKMRLLYRNGTTSNTWRAKIIQDIKTNSVRLEVIVSGSLPDKTRWFLGEKEIEPTETYQFSHHDEELAGSYKAKFYSNDGENSATFTVKAGNAPEFHDKPHIVQRDGGNIIVIKVRAKSHLEMTAEWFKDDKPLKTTDRIKILTKQDDKDKDGFQFLLEIHGPVKEDQAKMENKLLSARDEKFATSIKINSSYERFYDESANVRYWQFLR
ncbi:hypothetical protein DINM_004543 [Dirofilaria immitis]|nr:hypothetical protein [Dirofilaria immitis]